MRLAKLLIVSALIGTPVCAASPVTINNAANTASVGVTGTSLNVACTTGCSGGGGAGGAVYGPTAVGSNSANPPVQVGGTTTGAAGGPVSVLKVGSDGGITIDALPTIAVTAASGSYAAGSIVDLGTGATPAANTVNANLKALTPFAPTNPSTTNAVTTTSANTALPAGATVLVTNTGASTAYVALGASNAVVATTASFPIPSGQSIGLAVGPNTFIAAITATGGATSLTLTGGSGAGGLNGGCPLDSFGQCAVAIADGNTGLYPSLATGVPGSPAGGTASIQTPSGSAVVVSIQDSVSPAAAVSCTGATYSGGVITFTAASQSCMFDMGVPASPLSPNYNVFGGYQSLTATATGTFSMNLAAQYSNVPTGPFTSTNFTPDNAVAENYSVLSSLLSANNTAYSNRGGRYVLITNASFYASGTASVTLLFHHDLFPARSVVTVPLNAASTDASGTVTTGGTYQQIIASNTTRKGCMVQNPTTATEVLNVRVGATTVFGLTAGSIFNCATPAGVVITDAIFVTSATAAHAFAANVQ